MKTDKWLGFDFERNGWADWHENHSEAFDQFKRDFRSDLRTMLKGSHWEIHKMYYGGFEISGFIRHIATGKLMYFHTSDVRHWQDAWAENMLIRTAEHDHDWGGGSNNYTTFAGIPEYLAHAERWYVR